MPCLYDVTVTGGYKEQFQEEVETRQIFDMMTAVTMMVAAALCLSSSLSKKGFEVVRSVIRPDLIAELQGASEELLTHRSLSHLQADQFTGSLIPLSKHPVFAKLIGDEPVLTALKTLGLSDLRYMSGYIISKPPGSPSLGWHQDAWYWVRGGRHCTPHAAAR